MQLMQAAERKSLYPGKPINIRGYSRGFWDSSQTTSFASLSVRSRKKTG
jgi:hypothetical protein